jgi:methionyl-tRNA synthetase
MDATKLINPHNRLNPDDKLVVRESEHYFLDLSQTAEDLLDYLEERQHYWRPNVVKFTRNLINQGIESGLRGRAYTRDLNWGIPVPVEGWEHKRIYVWFEAVNGYFTASVEWAKNRGEPDAWKKWWYNPESKIYNFIGKDNIPFHTMIWPAELIGISGLYNDGDDTPINLPYDVPANEFITFEGKQFSKSRNWAVWVPDVLSRYQADALRFYIARTFPETSDSDFSWENFQTRVNNELVAAWGNLVNRMLGFAYKRFDAAVPEHGELTEDDQAIIARSEAAFDEIGNLLERVKLKEALDQVLALTREANAYLDKREPWKTIKEDREDAAKSVYTILRVIDNLKVLFAPFLPFSSQQVHEYLGYDGQLFGDLNIETFEEPTRSHRALVYDPSKAIGCWETSTLQPGQKLRKPSALFVKLDPEIVEQERSYLGAPRVESPIEV